MPQYNAKRVMHKFIGTQQSFTDGIGEWRDLVWTNTGGATYKSQFMAIGGFVLFKGVLQNQAGTWSATLPADIKSPTFFTPPLLYKTPNSVDDYNTIICGVTLTQNKIQVSTGGWSTPCSLNYLILNYKI